MYKISFYIIILILLSSCGGGGGGGGSSDSQIDAGSSTPTITVSISSSAQSAEVNSSVTLTWSSTAATSCSASGAWSGTKSTTGSESIIIGLGGSNNFSLTCSASGANSGSNSVLVNGIRYIEGTVFDGYIRGASIFIDENNNLTADGNETVIISDNNGKFSDLLYANGSLISVGGFDLDTGAELSNLTLVNELTGFEETKLISPFTTLIAHLSDSSNLNEILGVDASIDLMNVDPIPLLGEGIYDYMYEKGNQLTVLSYSLQNFFGDENSLVYFRAIANELEEQFSENQVIIDIESSSFINAVIDEAEELKSSIIAQETEENLRTVISAVLPTLRVHPESTSTTAVQRFAFNTLQDDLKDSSILTNSASTTLQKYQNEIYAYIASVESIEESLINPNFNTPPVISSSASFTVDENQLSIGTISATDPDGDSLIFSVSGAEIAISGNGVMTFVSAPDYETKSSYTVTVTVSDGVTSVTQTININILDVDESALNQAPTISSSASFTADENQTSIGSIVASDADGDSLTFSISGSEINISGTGVLTFATAPDYETKNSYTATVTVSDGISSATQIITVNITEVPDQIDNNPPVLSELTFTPTSVNVSSSTAQVTATVRVTDETNVNIPASPPFFLGVNISTATISANSTWQLTSGNSQDGVYQATFTIPQGKTAGDYTLGTQSFTDDNENSAACNSTLDCVAQGQAAALTVISSSDSNPPVLSELTFTPTSVNVSSSTAQVTATVRVTDETNVNIPASPPFFLGVNISTATISANSTWQLTSGNSQDGVYQATFTIPQGKTAGDYTLGTQSFTDDNENSAACNSTLDCVAQGQAATLTISNTNQAPTISSAASFNANENQTSIGSIVASDANGDSLTFSISGSEINISSSGVLSFVSSPDYETKNSYTATVTVSDGTNSTNQNITVNINDIALASDTDSLTLNGTAGSDTLQGGAGDDTILGLAGDDIMSGGAGNDVLRGGLDVDTINGGDGNDIISADECYDFFDIPFSDITTACGEPTFGGQDLNGGAGNDIIYGNGAGDAVILGGSGNDTIYIVSGMSSLAYADGEDGDDVLLNNTNNGGDSILRGGNGDDNLHGGAGADVLTGGPGADKFVIKSGEGSGNLGNVSIVTDFVDGLDKILLVGGLAFSDLTIVDPSSEQRADFPDAVGDASKLVFEVNDGASYLLIVKQDRDASIGEPFVLDSNDFETGGEIR